MKIEKTKRFEIYLPGFDIDDPNTWDKCREFRTCTTSEIEECGYEFQEVDNEEIEECPTCGHCIQN